MVEAAFGIDLWSIHGIAWPVHRMLIDYDTPHVWFCELTIMLSEV